MYAVPLLLLGATSCKKDNPVCPVAPVVVQNYSMPNVPGSYWVYETFITDSLGVTTSTGNIDTLHLIGETQSNGNTYNTFYRSSNPSVLYYERDSSGYIVGKNGNILYSHVNFGEILYESIQPFQGPFGTTLNSRLRSYMIDDSQTAHSVPAGTFYTINRRTRLDETSGLPINACGDLSFDSDQRYADGIGLISKKSAYFSQIVNECKYFEEVLIDYFIP
jgi:hypothetical protein